MLSQISRNKKIKELKQKGLTYQEIGNNFGLSRQRVHQIISQDIIGRGREKENRKKIQGREFLKEKVRRRDNYFCQKCGKKWKSGTRRLDVHHKNFMDSQTDAKKYKNNKDMDQLITLCHKCHLNLPEHRKKMSEAMLENK